VLGQLKIHFLNVGHGDCTIIEFPNRLTVVDINNCKQLAAPTRAELRKKYSSSWESILGGPNYVDSRLAKDQEHLVDPIDYLKSRFGIRSIHRYVQTHPDMDHMGGLYRLGMEGFSIVNFWDTDNSLSKDMELNKWAQVNHDEKDWNRYQDFRAGKFSDCTVLKLQQGASSQFYKDDGISIWAPLENTRSKDPNADPNYFSYVLQIQLGACSIVLGGDLPSDMWDKLLERNGNTLPKVNLLKASHHGRKSGYSLNAVKAMAPDLTVCSVGELHSKHDASASYERFSEHGCWSTTEHGTIVATCWSDGDVWLDDDRGEPLVRTRYAMPK
jgi:competence protein ComEC